MAGPSIKKMNWSREEVVEKKMDSLGIKWEWRVGLSANKIDVEASQQNNARYDAAIIEKAASDYQAHMTNGSSFPGIVVFLAKWLILAGNHRFKAAVANGQATIDCYVITSAEECAIQRFIVWDNARHPPITLSLEEKKAHCVDLHMTCKLPLRDVVMEVLGSTSYLDSVKDMVNEAKVRYDLQVTGISVHKIEEVAVASPGALRWLFPLAPSKEGGLRNVKLLVESFKVIRDFGLSGNQTKEMVDSIREQGDERGQMGALILFKETLKAKVELEKTPVSPDCTKLRRAVTGMYLLLCCDQTFNSFKDFPITDDEERKTLVGKFRDIRRALSKLEGSYRKEK